MDDSVTVQNYYILEAPVSQTEVHAKTEDVDGVSILPLSGPTSICWFKL